MKKALSFILALALIISLVPSVVFAEDTATEPYSLTIDFGSTNILTNGAQIGEPAVTTTGATDGSEPYTQTVVTTYETHITTVITNYNADGSIAQKEDDDGNIVDDITEGRKKYRSSSAAAKDGSWSTVYNECADHFSAQTRILTVSSVKLLQIETEGDGNWAEATEAENQFVINVELGEAAEAGWYQIAFTGGDWYPASDLYIYANDKYIGQYIPTKLIQSSPAAGSEATYGAVYLEPDAENKVKFKFAIAERGYNANVTANEYTGTYGQGRILLKNLKLTYLGAEEEYGYSVKHTIPDELDYTTYADGFAFTAYADAGDGVVRAMNGINSDRTTEGADSFSVEIVEGNSVELTKTITNGVCTGTLVPKKLGDTTIKLTATINGDTYTDTKKVSVTSDVPIPVTLDFTDVTLKDGTTSLTPAQWTVGENAGWVVDTEYTREAAFYSQNVYSTGLFAIEMRRGSKGWTPWWALSAVSQNNHTNARPLLFTVKTTDTIEEGDYRIKIKGGKYAEGGRIFVYVNEQFAGLFDCYDATATSAPIARENEIVLNTLHLVPETDDEGNSFVRIRLAYAEQADNQRSVAILSSITLEPVSGTDTTTPDKIVIVAPETADLNTPVDISAYVQMKDGSKRSLSGIKKSDRDKYYYCAAKDTDNYIDITTSENAEFVADYSGLKGYTDQGVFTNEDGIATGTLTANMSGTTTVTVNAKINGIALPTAMATIDVPYTDGSDKAQDNVSYIVRAANSNFNEYALDMGTYEAGAVGSHPINTSFTAVAKDKITVDNVDYNFAYWQSPGGTPVEDAGASYTFTPKSNFTLEAVYAPAEPAATDKKVQFWNYNRAFIDEQSVNADGTVAAMPTAPTLAGHTFTGWAAENIGEFGADTQLTAALTRVVAQFTADADKYTVKVDGTEEDKYAYGDLFEKTAAEAPEGKVFSHWAVGDTIVSYNSTISFYVWNNIELTAVYAEAAPTAVPTVMLDSIDDEYFIAYQMPTGYTPIDAGIVFGSNDPRVDSTDGSKASVREVKAMGQFTAMPNPDAAHTVARGYVIYKVDATGDVRVLYTK